MFANYITDTLTIVCESRLVSPFYFDVLSNDSTLSRFYSQTMTHQTILFETELYNTVFADLDFIFCDLWNLADAKNGWTSLKYLKWRQRSGKERPLRVKIRVFGNLVFTERWSSLTPEHSHCSITTKIKLYLQEILCFTLFTFIYLKLVLRTAGQTPLGGLWWRKD